MTLARRELFDRSPANPILTAADWPYAVNAVFNPAAALVDGVTVLLARVEVRMTSQRGARLAEGWAEVELPRE